MSNLQNLVAIKPGQRLNPEGHNQYTAKPKKWLDAKLQPEAAKKLLLRLGLDISCEFLTMRDALKLVAMSKGLLGEKDVAGSLPAIQECLDREDGKAIATIHNTGDMKIDIAKGPELNGVEA